MRQESAGGQRLTKWLSGIALGAVAMYLVDPAQGRRRRALMQDKLYRMAHKTGDAAKVAMRDARNRLVGLQAQLMGRFLERNRPIDDRVLTARVRSKLGRVVTNPHAIEVLAQQGRVTLSGPILAEEREPLLELVRAIPGVTEVRDRLEPHDPSENIPVLQGKNGRAHKRTEFMQHAWTPTMRAAAIAGGGVLGYYGMKQQRSPLRMLLTAAGLGLMARGATNLELRQLLGLRGAGPAIDLQKTIEIDAPPELVFDLWSNYENFPRFMSNVIEVRDLGNGRSRWIVKGPAGTIVEWDSTLTEIRRPEIIAWKSEPGSPVEHTGSVRFEPWNGGTRATIRMSYSPPAGALGHGLAVLLGSDPKHKLDEDLMRMKSFIESGIPPHDAVKPISTSSQTLH